MAITIRPKKATATAKASTKVPFVLIDNSGAFTILTVIVPGLQPITHAFSLHEGRYQADVDLSKGVYDCSFTVQAFEDGSINRMYDCALEIDGTVVSTASGNIPKAATWDVGFGSVQLTVV